MSWVNGENLQEALKMLSSVPFEQINKQYSDLLSYEIDDQLFETTIISSEHWITSTERPNITIVDDALDTNVRGDDLEAIARLLAYQQDGVEELPENKSVEDYMWNGATYAVDSQLSLSKPPGEFSLKESDFYSVISHTSRLLGDLQSDSFRTKRNSYFDTTGSIIRNINKFYRPLGGTYLTVVLDEDGTYYLLVGKRSDKVVFWPNLTTAFPAGYFKPTEISYGDTIDQHLLSEYSREAMNSELHKQSTNTSKGVTAMTQLFRADNASFTVTGFGIESVTVAAELTGVLLIENPEYTQYLFENLQQSYDVSHVTAIPIQETTKEKLLQLCNASMTPQTSFALGAGLKHLNKHTNVPVPFDVTPQFE